MTDRSAVFIRCELFPTKEMVFGQAVVDRLSSLEPGLFYETPESVQLLPDTVSRGQWAKKRTYFGQGLGGTDWPERWLVSFPDEVAA